MIKASPATLNNTSQRATVYNMNTPEREKERPNEMAAVVS